MTTTTERMATMARVTRSSMRVKEDLLDEPACRQAGVKDWREVIGRIIVKL
jgi:hypothetical protein